MSVVYMYIILKGTILLSQKYWVFQNKNSTIKKNLKSNNFISKKSCNALIPK